MHLANLKLWNFRKYGSTGALNIENPNLNLNFHNGLNVLIGENDSGKTAIIDAIKLVLKTHSYEFIKISKEDFFKGADEFRIELVFKDFTNEEAGHFAEWLSYEGEGGNAKPYLKLSYHVIKKDDRIRSSDIRAGIEEGGALLDAQAKRFF